MSGKVVSWAFEQKTGSQAAKLVLVKLADNANDHGFCWTGIKKIIEHTELKQATVYKYVTLLEKLGLMKRLDALHPEHGYPIEAFQLAVPAEWQLIPPRGKAKGQIPPGGKTIPPHGKEIPPGGKTIPPGGMHIDEPSSEPPIEPSDEPETAAPVAGDLFGGDPPPVLTKAEILDLAFGAYDQAAGRLGWGECQARTDTRRKKLARRIEDAGGLDGWTAALEKSEVSDFLMGKTPPRPDQPRFKLDIDFLLQQSSFVKLMEGKYDNREGTGSPSGGGFLAAAARRSAAHPD